jgi:hypothetical protein
MVLVMPAQAGIHDFNRIDPQAVDGRNKPVHYGSEMSIVPACKSDAEFAER